MSWLDAEYLGYADSDVGRVVIKTSLPTEQAVKSLLGKHGFGPKDAEWSDALKRLAQRQEELHTQDAGNFKNLQTLADDGSVKINF